jgi:hypothetical protein
VAVNRTPIKATPAGKRCTTRVRLGSLPTADGPDLRNKPPSPVIEPSRRECINKQAIESPA